MVPKTQNFPSGLTYYNQSLSLNCVEKQSLTNIDEQPPQGISQGTSGLNPEVNVNKQMQVKSLLTNAKELKPTPVPSMQVQKVKITPATRQDWRPEIKKADPLRKVPKTADGQRKRENKENLNATNTECMRKGQKSGTTTTTASVATLSQTTDHSASQERNAKIPNLKQVKASVEQRGRGKSKNVVNPWARDYSKSREDFGRSTSKPNFRYSIAEGEETKEKETEKKKEKEPEEDVFEMDLEEKRKFNHHQSPSKEESSFCRYDSLLKQNSYEKKKVVIASDQKSQSFNPMNSIRKFGEDFQDMMDDFEDIEEKINSEQALNSSASFIKSANQAAMTIKPTNPLEKYSVSDLLSQKTHLLHKGGDNENNGLSKKEEEENEDDILEDSLQDIRNPRTPIDTKKNKYEQQATNTLPRMQPYSPPFSGMPQTLEQVMNTRGKVTQALIVENHDTDDDNHDDEEVPEPIRKLDLEKTAQEKLNLNDLNDDGDCDSGEVEEGGSDCEFEDNAEDDGDNTKDNGEEGTLNVVFDPVLNCYYHPPTNTYFELKQ